jgi:REG-2-like HAD superfamily hydrolase
MVARQMLKLVTFDPTGTLFRPAMEVGVAYLAVVAKHQQRLGGPPLPSPCEVSKAFHDSYRLQMLKNPCFGHDDGLSNRDWWEATVRSTFLHTGMLPYFYDSFDEIYGEAFDGSKEGGFWARNSGAVECLASLAGRGATIGVISNSDVRYHDILHNLGLRPHLDFVHVSGETGWAKPDPMAFGEALLAAGRVRGETVAAEHAVHVGVSASNDVLGALDAGWSAVYCGDANMGNR